MVYSPNRQPLRELTDRRLQEMAILQAKKVIYALGDIIAEQTYRDQRRLAKWVAMLIGGTLIANVVAIVLKAIM